MEANRLYKEGKLGDAIALLQDELRSDPHDVPRRTFLFELLCFQGQFDRAWKQLEVIETADPSSYLGTAWFKQVLKAEETRQEMFTKSDLPDRLDEEAPVSGTLNGEPFSDLRDADPRIGPRLEVIAGGRYLWVPFSELSTVEVSPPKLLRDLYWASGELSSFGPDAGEPTEVLLPAMTALAWQNPDEMVRLGRVTEWAGLDSGEEAPVGQKLLLVDDEDFPLLEVREITFDR
ncbi:MAG: type VI secretion system accessory protein TagJ [Gemmatimonadota bacterium]